MMRSRRLLQGLGFAAAIATLAPGCVVRARGTARIGVPVVVVHEAPPQPEMEAEYGTTRAGFVWVRGNHVWNNGRWQWKKGHWERANAGHSWNDGRWEQRGNDWHWIEGSWVAGGSVNAGGGGGGPTVIDHRDQGGGGVTVVDHRDQPPAQSIYPTAPPPAPQVENPGTKDKHVWIRGRYEWKAGAYAWIPGHWERAKASKQWADGRWELSGSYYVWIDGSWN